jgi:uncharacterized protein (DUF1810 family)
MVFDLDRFRRAQQGAIGFDTALRELQAGRKRSHWIWYIFPQLDGLGSSPGAGHYGVQGVAEATEYLRDPVLRGRLLAVTNAVLVQLQRQPAPTLIEILGSRIDALKLVSSMTLFREVARRLNAIESSPDHAELAARADVVLGYAARQGFVECPFTLDRLAS